MINKCPNGHEVNGGFKYCPYCGAEINNYELNEESHYSRENGLFFKKMTVTPNDNSKTIGIILAVFIVVGGFLLFLLTQSSDITETDDNVNLTKGFNEYGNCYNSLMHRNDIDSISIHHLENDVEHVERLSSNDNYNADAVNFEENEEQYSNDPTNILFSFCTVEDVYILLKNKNFYHPTSHVSLSYDDTCQLYINGEWNSGIFEVLKYSLYSAIIQYHSPSDGTMRLMVSIVNNRIQLMDPIDGSIFYQK